MGFIDYHGNKENHYEDVVEFAKMRQEEEMRRMEEAQIRKWFGEKLGDLRYSKLESSTLIKYMMREYQMMFRVYGDMISRETEILPFDSEQLWKDFWVYFLCESAEVFLTKEKIVPFVEMFIKKVLRISDIISYEINQQFVSGNYRYKKYFRKTFAYTENGKKLFWRFICLKSDRKYEQAAQFITSFGRFQLLLYYYFYLTSTSGCNGHQWKITLIRCQQEIGNMSQMKWMKSCTVPDTRLMVNPVFGKKCKSLSGDLLRSMRVILFQLKKPSKDKEKEFLMIEELYFKLQEEETKPSPLQSILPENVKQNIMDGKLPEFPHPDVSGLAPEEKLFYLNHTVLYQERESEDEILFYNYKGTVYFTDKRIMFRGKDSLAIFYENIDRIVEYDLIPEFLEIKTGNKSNFFQIPDAETAYRILKLIANRNRGEPVIKVDAPFTYEELVDKADIGACIFAFEYVIAGDIPEELNSMICELNVKLRGLQRTIEKYPERKEEIYQFLKYYIPEAVKVVTSYQDYQGVGLEEQTMKNMYKKIVIAVKALDHAVTQKIIDMYHLEVMDTVARAEALREILGQDGFVDPEYKMQ